MRKYAVSKEVKRNQHEKLEESEEKTQQRISLLGEQGLSTLDWVILFLSKAISKMNSSLP